MTLHPHARRHGGQAAVETVALAALVALLLAVVAAWAVRALPGGVAPPPLVQRAAAPLRPPPALAPPRAAPGSVTRGATPAWRRLARGARALLTLRLEAELAFDRGLAAAVRARLAAAWRDGRAHVPGAGPAPPPAGAADGRGAARRVRDYLTRLRRMTRREAVLRVSEDLGALVGDRGLDLLTRGAARRVARGRRPPPRPAPGSRRPPRPAAAAPSAP